MQTNDRLAEARRLLSEHFGYDSFRPAQESLISAVLAGRDALGIMPTGAGKSMCYQIPALMLPGITLVVSPLISLMQDQVRALKAAGIRGAYLNSALTAAQYALALRNAREGLYKIIYVAPERLGSAEFLDFARSARISLLAVDEAHCVSAWGHDFRPSYMEIASFVEKLPVRPPVAAFTATATPAVRQDILHHLRLRNPQTEVTGFDRENLMLRVLRPHDKMAVLREFLRQHADESGIVYCSTRKQAEYAGEQLQLAGISTAVYHAGVEEAARRERQNRFLYDELRVMVATNAFGMGIDKQNVSFVVHYNMPKNIESYYQEAGRAGRDGAPAECLLLYSAGDVRTAEYLIRAALEDADPQTAGERRRIEMEKLEQMKAYCLTSGCLRHHILDYFGQTSPLHCGRCGNCEEHASPARKSSRPQKTLYDLLRSVRKDYADQTGLPPELIFSDRTLREMAARRPQNEHEMLEIPGVSPGKYRQYGKTFLRVIQRSEHRRSGVE